MIIDKRKMMKKWAGILIRNLSCRMNFGFFQVKALTKSRENALSKAKKGTLSLQSLRIWQENEYAILYYLAELLSDETI